MAAAPQPDSHLANLFQLLAAEPLLAGVHQAVGAQHLQQQQAPPAVVWVPTDDAYTSPRGYAGDGVNNPRTIWNSGVQVQCTLWAAKVLPSGQLDPAATEQDHVAALEQLRNRVLQACQRQAWAGYSYSPKGGKWAWADGQSIKFGVGYILLIEFALSVTMPPEPEAVMQQLPITTTMQFPNGNTVENV